MNIDQTIKRTVFIQWMKNCQAQFEMFQKRMKTQFQKTFAELEQSYQDKYQTIINNQQEQIKQLKTKLHTFSKIQQLISGDHPKSSLVQPQNKQSLQQQSTIYHHQQQYQQIDSKSGFEENDGVQSQKQQNPPKLIRDLIQQRGNRHLGESNEEQQKVEREQDQFGQQHVLQLANNYQQPHHLQPLPPKPRPRTLPPLTRQPNHYLCHASLTPNFTPISFIQYQPYQDCIFDQNNIQYLQKHDLKQVESIKIQNLEMDDYYFDRLVTSVQWGNVISLQVDLDGNCLTNLDPIKNLPFTKLVHLDVSNNELSTSSAQLLASTQFNSLIYFTLSFKTGINNQCWQILLRNNMSNFPKLQAIDICNANQLNDDIIDRIKQCMSDKAIEQKITSQTINSQGQKTNYYPEDYQIKIKWEQSQEIQQKMTKQQAQQMIKMWRAEVKYKACNAPKFTRQKQLMMKRSKNKRKQIQKIK